MKNNYPRLARREFLSTAAGVGGAMLVGPWMNAVADGVDPRVAQAMSKTIGIDMHNHVYPEGTEPHPRGQPRGRRSNHGFPNFSLEKSFDSQG